MRAELIPVCQGANCTVRPMPIALHATNLWKAYLAGVSGCSARVWALRGCSLVARRGERLAIVGGAASGKTSLLHCLGGLRRVDAGSVINEGGLRARVTVVGALRHADAAALALLDADHDRATTPDDSAWLEQLHALPRHRTIVLATRDPMLAVTFADRVIRLVDGRIDDPAVAPARRVAECGRPPVELPMLR